MNDRHCYNIGLLLIDGFPLMSYASVVEPLRAANTLSGHKLYNVTDINVSGEIATSSSGAVLKAKNFSTIEHNFELLLILAGGDPLAFNNKPVFDWLRKQSRFGVKLGGISGGPAILVSAGLITAQRFTVHWEHVAALKEISPSLHIEPSLYVIDRDRVTCAGGAAVIDLMHAVIAQQHGFNFARLVNDWLLNTDIRPSNAPQRAGKIDQYGTTNKIIIQSIEIMENNLGEPLSLSEISAILEISPRQLNRQFNEILKQSTMQFYRELRLKYAQNLLMNTTLNITDIAFATGFAGSSHFCSAYSKVYDKSPASTRKNTRNT